MGPSSNISGTDALDARSFLAVTKDPRHLNDLGATFGGPIFIPRKFNTSKNKLFFFAAFEQKYYHVASAAVSVVPTALERSGNFLGSKLGTPIDPLNGAAFPGSVIPEYQIFGERPQVAGSLSASELRQLRQVTSCETGYPHKSRPNTR